jgi:hypothetical protein
MKKHRWKWVSNWWAFWRPPTKRCERCGAELRFPRSGPRRGIEYAYRERLMPAFFPVRVLPPCDPPDLKAEAIEEAVRFEKAHPR